MDTHKIGAVIAHARKERHMTQRELASQLCLSDKTISKWERGLGCPNISILRELATILGIALDGLLEGTLQTKPLETGNMKHIKFYVCPTCMNIQMSSNETNSICCGKPLKVLDAAAPSDAHHPHIEVIGHEYYIHIDHEMSKTHYLGFIAHVTSNELQFVRFYPEQSAETYMRINGSGLLYIWCNRDGLFVMPTR